MSEKSSKSEITLTTYGELLYLRSKIDKPGFMIGCEPNYFDQFAKVLFFSLRKHCPWANVHFHLVDATPANIAWLTTHDCTFSSEVTPAEYCIDPFNKVLYCCAARYFRVPDIYKDNTRVIVLDADSIMVRPLPREKFLTDLSKSSWVPVREKGGKRKSLASALGFGVDNVRHVFANYLKEGPYYWDKDQGILNGMIERAEISTMDLRYTTHRFESSRPYRRDNWHSSLVTRDNCYIWTAKGHDRKKSPAFIKESSKYKFL